MRAVLLLRSRNRAVGAAVTGAAPAAGQRGVGGEMDFEDPGQLPAPWSDRSGARWETAGRRLDDFGVVHAVIERGQQLLHFAAVQELKIGVATLRVPLASTTLSTTATGNSDSTLTGGTTTSKPCALNSDHDAQDLGLEGDQHVALAVAREGQRGGTASGGEVVVAQHLADETLDLRLSPLNFSLA